MYKKFQVRFSYIIALSNTIFCLYEKSHTIGHSVRIDGDLPFVSGKSRGWLQYWHEQV